jgi:hypothetical protein
VVQASEKVVPILVDCTRQGSHQTLLFVGPDGESLGGVDQRDAATLIQQIDRFSKPPGRSSLPALAFLFVFAVAVVGGLVFAYNKWFATTAEE